MYIEIFTAGIAVMLTSLSGVLFMWHGFKNVIQKNLKFLVTFAMGVFGTTLFLMLSETMHLEASLGAVAIAAAVGALTLEVLQRLIPEAHHHHGADEGECCDHEHGDEHAVNKINPRRILLGDAAHNIGDGIMLVPAYLLSFHIGLSVTIGIILHEVVQEISEFFILKEAGYSTKRALISNLIVSSTIFIGIGISLFIATATEYMHLLIAFAAGGILYIIVRDLLPHTIERIKHSGGLAIHIAVFILGTIIMLSATNILPHSHELHDDELEHMHENDGHAQDMHEHHEEDHTH